MQISGFPKVVSKRTLRPKSPPKDKGKAPMKENRTFTNALVKEIGKLKDTIRKLENGLEAKSMALASMYETQKTMFALHEGMIENAKQKTETLEGYRREYKVVCEELVECQKEKDDLKKKNMELEAELAVYKWDWKPVISDSE